MLLRGDIKTIGCLYSLFAVTLANGLSGGRKSKMVGILNYLVVGKELIGV